MKPACLLHACCAPCTTHSWRALKADYDVTVFFYNPNIHPETEYRHRENEMAALGQRWGFSVVTGVYDADRWFDMTKGLEEAPEGGPRCALCFRMRLEATAKRAVAMGIPHITTTLTISPHKKPAVIFPIGRAVAAQYGLTFLEIDFKKKDGFKESCRLSHEEGLYRQDYCGCIYSQHEAEARRQNRCR